MVQEQWREAASTALGGSLDHWQGIGGGDFASAWTVVLQLNGKERTVFVKTHANPPPRHFTTEANGLRWLAEPEVMPVAEVLAVSDDPPFLALGFIEEGGRRSAAGEAAFGRALAHLHASGAPAFGREDRRSTGSLGLPNDPLDNWQAFYAERRLLPLVRIAAERRALPPPVLAGIEAVAGKLTDIVPGDETPARLHGDLWAGNRLVDIEGRSWLIDPAAHGGHREFDLAMMRLFGGFGEEAFAAYHEVNPLEPGWQSRVDLHQLAPLIVHAIKFGGHYGAEVARVVDRYA